MTERPACTSAELREAVPHVVRLGQREIAIVRREQAIFAVHGVCPHQHASFRAGTIHHRVSLGLEPGELTVDPDEPLLRCPWHGWEFSLTSGRCLVDRGLRIRCYRVAERDGVVFVDLGAEADRS
jgi:nitrite reductase (NADH) small subunit